MTDWLEQADQSRSVHGAGYADAIQTSYDQVSRVLPNKLKKLHLTALFITDWMMALNQPNASKCDV